MFIIRSCKGHTPLQPVALTIPSLSTLLVAAEYLALASATYRVVFISGDFVCGQESYVYRAGVCHSLEESIDFEDTPSFEDDGNTLLHVCNMHTQHTLSKVQREHTHQRQIRGGGGGGGGVRGPLTSHFPTQPIARVCPCTLYIAMEV